MFELFVFASGKKQEFDQLTQTLDTSVKQLENSNETLQKLHQELDQTRKEVSDNRQKVAQLTRTLDQSKQQQLTINELETNFNQQIAVKEAEITKLKQESKQSTALLRGELEKLKQEKDQRIRELTDQLQNQDQLLKKNQEFEKQLTALTLSSGLLAQRCEDLNKNLTESEQKEAQIKIENDIKANLLQQKEQELKNKDTTIT